MKHDILLFFLSFLSFFLVTLRAADTINTTQLIKDGESLVSSDGSFEFGFFSPGSSGKKYVGIWFRKISAKTVVWVANRETSLTNSNGTLKLTDRSTLVLINSTGGIVWQSNSSRSVHNPIVQLLDTGNLVVRDKNDQNPKNYVWQSFDYPCHVDLPGMKLGWNLVTGLDRHLSSWKSSDDPSPGDYTHGVDPHGYPQLLLKKGADIQYRSGPWNGIGFSANPRLMPNSVYTYNFVLSDEEIYFVYELVNIPLIMIKVLNDDGAVVRVVWDDRTQGWVTYSNPVSDNCDIYALCGPFATCSAESSVQCECLTGFVPKDPQAWNSGTWLDGCVRKTVLNFSNANGFFKYSNVKLPDTRYSWYDTSMALDECKVKCLQNFSCIAYATLDITTQRGCLLWFDVLIDIKVFPEHDQVLYVRMDASELGKHKQKVRIATSVTAIAVLLLSLSTTLYVWCRKRVKRKGKAGTTDAECYSNDDQKEEFELPLFSLKVLSEATNDFADFNRLGEGGFGPVYKGVLKGGQEIAVKRLSHDSKQGQEEFKNEVKCIAKLQHRNLVKLVGYCNEAEERLLVYEFMPNKSLDVYIFDEAKSMLLDWPTRFEIIYGIARGLVYLHHDSRMRIIHRDLKASNILLDHEMKPKISDFGMARMFDGEELAAKTRRVVGTYGYMSPEYAVDGIFSTKSDVFSFGVLVLEIVSGQSNRGFSHPEHHHNLLGHAWRLFKEGREYELVDPSITTPDYASQILRSIHVGLLCVQENAEDRPYMSLVTLMLSGDSKLPWPKQPGFYVRRHAVNGELQVSSGDLALSGNQEPITIVSAR